MSTQTAIIGDQSTLRKYFGAAMDGILGSCYDITQVLMPIEIAMRGVEPVISPIEVIAKEHSENYTQLQQHNGLSAQKYHCLLCPYTPKSDSKGSKGTRKYNGPSRVYNGREKKQNKGVVSMRHDRLRKVKIGFVKHSSVF